MRLAPLAVLGLLVGCGPGIDPLIGSYTFTLTGTDTNTAPNTNSVTPTGTGTLAVTANAAADGYVITAAQTDASPCVIEGTAADKATSPELTVKTEQKCVFVSGPTTTTATFSSGKAVLKLNDTRAMDVLTLDVAYSYAGTTVVLGFTSNFAGTGKRTYTGTRR
jgi:hypothetical protein